MFRSSRREPQTAAAMTANTQLFPFLRQGAFDTSGGHHDAGDYSKYTINSASLVHYLMFAVDSLAGVAALDNLGIPESGDGISDVLQEAKLESDYLAKLQDADGGFYFLVYPHDRAYESNVLPDHGVPVPPLDWSVRLQPVGGRPLGEPLRRRGGERHAAERRDG